MLYSNPAGSGLAAPPAVLVQGEAVCPDQILTHSDELEDTDTGWVFRPRQLVPGMDTTPLSNLRLLRNGRPTARRYLAARGLPRPMIPWAHYAQLKNQARAEAGSRSSPASTSAS